MKKRMRFSLLLILGVIFSTATVFAQQQQMPPQPEPLNPEEVSDNDLQTVAAISESMNVIQKDAENNMKKVLEGEGMEFTRFQQIMMAQQNPQMAGEVEITQEEQETLQKVQPELTQLNQQAQQEFVTTIEGEGLTIQKFQQLAQAIQTHPELAERLQQIRAEENDN